MAWLLRRAVGLVAAYAIAFQAVLSGILTASHALADPLSITCVTDDPGADAVITKNAARIHCAGAVGELDLTQWAHNFRTVLSRE